MDRIYWQNVNTGPRQHNIVFDYVFTVKVYAMCYYYYIILL